MAQSTLPLSTPPREAAPARPTVRTIRADLADGTLTLADVLRDPPAAIGEWSILEVVALRGQWGRARRAVLNDEAVMAGCNLALPVAAAAPEVVEWVVRALERLPIYRTGALEDVVERGRARGVVRGAQWRARARILDDAIRRHRAMCEDESAPPESFAQADAQLYGARDRTMDGTPVLAEVVEQPLTLPAAPFAEWLAERREELGNGDELLTISETWKRTGVHERTLRAIASGERLSVRAFDVERALDGLGGGSLFDLYPGV